MKKPDWWNARGSSLRRWKWFGAIGALRRAETTLRSAKDNKDLPPMIRATAEDALAKTRIITAEMVSFLQDRNKKGVL